VGALNLIERGLCLLERVRNTHDMQAKMTESLVLLAAAHQMDLVDAAQSTMAAALGLPSSLGFTWERALALVVHDRFLNLESFQNDKIVQLLQSNMLRNLVNDGRFSDKSMIPMWASFGQSGKKRGDLVQWLEECCCYQAVDAASKLGFLSRRSCWSRPCRLAMDWEQVPCGFPSGQTQARC
jgi:hypothetical protein